MQSIVGRAQRSLDRDRARRAAETPDHYVYAIAKKKKALINASPQLPMSTDVRSLDRSRLPLARSAIKSRVLMHAYATRGLGFLVRCATIQGRLTTERRLAPLYNNHTLKASNFTIFLGACPQTPLGACDYHTYFSVDEHPQ